MFLVLIFVLKIIIIKKKDAFMCDLPVSILNKLTKTIEQFLEEGKTFSGYDVTIATREREKISLRHEDIRSGIHEIDLLKDAVSFGFDQSNGNTIRYRKSQINMPDGPAFVYHPDGIDPKSYQPRQKIKKYVSSIKSMPKQQTIGVYNTDSRNRLLVPTKFLRGAGFFPGDEVAILNDSGTKSIIITGKNGNHNAIITKQQVEKDGDIRLSSKTLRCISNEDKFNITLQSGHIIITKVSKMNG